MSSQVAIVSSGLVTSVGLSSPATCAAVRAKIANPTETRFLAHSGEWIMGHQVPLVPSVRGRARLVAMAALAIEECLADVPQQQWHGCPLILCIAEQERPGRLDGLDDALFSEIEASLGVQFDGPNSLMVPHGRIGVAVAIQHARRLLYEGGIDAVLIAATDSLLVSQTLGSLERDGRLLVPGNSDGFLPGEGAGALMVAKPDHRPRLACTGIGLATEAAHIDSALPLRADGLAGAIRIALQEAGCAIQDIDYRICDVSGEQFYFKESALALARLLRVSRPEFDIWHPAECVGETGSLAGILAITVAEAACRKGYSPGRRMLCHAANDSGHRMAAVMQYPEA